MRSTYKRIHELHTAAALAALLFFGGIHRLCSMEVRRELNEPRVGARSLNRLPLYFIENGGRFDSQVGFHVRGRDKSVFFGSEGVTYSLRGHDRATASEETWAVKIQFVGARRTMPTGMSSAPGTVSFFGGREGEADHVSRTFREIVYKDLWPGIDLSYTGERGELKYQFIVAPEADPTPIRLAYQGGELALDASGRLVVSTPLGELYDDQPFAFQEVLGERGEVEAIYELDAERGTVGFMLGDYDRKRELVIDPVVTVNAGFFGGSGDDEANDVAVDAAGNVYVVGNTTSAEDSFPAKAGPGRRYRGGGACVLNLPCGDAFVAKLDPNGELVYAGYIGGAGADTGSAIAVDSEGAAYVTGTTSSTEATFPVRNGPDLTFNRGGSGFTTDAYVAKIDPTGASLVYAGYIGGAEGDQGADIAVDSAGNAYVVGNANSPQSSFPVRVGPDLTHNSFSPGNQSTDAFIAKVNPNGELVYAGYIGGLSGDVGHGVAVDDSGAAYVTGTSFSREGSFPVKVGPDLTYNDPPAAFNGDAFVAKVAPDGRGFVYAGYVGGASTDFGGKIAVDRDGSAYLYGVTASDERSFPVLVGPDVSFNSAACRASQFSFACTDIFVAKVKPDGSALSYAGYIGGKDNESDAQVPFPRGGITVDPVGHAYVTGPTLSNEQTFPVTDGPGLSMNEGTCGLFPFQRTCAEAFVAKIAVDGASLVYAGYIGGEGDDRAGGIAVDTVGTAYVAGGTTSDPARFAQPGAPAQSVSGGVDVFIAQISSEPAMELTNGAGFGRGPIAPGEIVSIFGSELGPATPSSGTVDASGRVAAVLAGTEVRFNGVPAPLLFAGGGQINAQVPYEVQGLSDVRVKVVRQGVIRGEATVSVAQSAPGLFTVDNGRGQVVAVHQDGSFNSAARPARPAEIVTLYATGEGATTPGGTTGQLAETPLPRPIAPVTLTIAGQQAEILYAGAAPGFVGLMQINARIPSNIASGPALPVRLQVGSASSQPGVSLAAGR